MSVKRKKAAPAEQARSTGAPAGAEAIAVGTAAGAMMLGVAHADAAKAEQALKTVAATRPEDDADKVEATLANRDGDAVAFHSDHPNLKSAQFKSGDIKSDESVQADAAPQPAMAERQIAATASAEPVSTDRATAEGGEASGRDAVVGAAESLPAAAAEPATATPPGAAATSALAAIDAAATASIPLPQIIDTSALATRIADQITSAINQISSGAAGGASTAALAETIAGDIAATVADIATGITASLPKPAELVQTITAQVGGVLDASPAGAISDIAVPVAGDLAQTITARVDDLLAASSFSALSDIAVPAAADLAETISTQIAGVVDASPAAPLADIATDIPVPAMANVAETVAGLDAFQMLDTLPSTLLGAESENAAPGGLLTEIFYSDGDSATAASAPAVPPADPAPIDLANTVSDAASTLIADIAPISIDFAGLSYADAPDMPGGGLAGSSLNALHLA